MLTQEDVDAFNKFREDLLEYEEKKERERLEREAQERVQLAEAKSVKKSLSVKSSNALRLNA